MKDSAAENVTFHTSSAIKKITKLKNIEFKSHTSNGVNLNEVNLVKNERFKIKMKIKGL